MKRAALLVALVLAAPAQAHPLEGQGQMVRVASEYFEPICAPARIVSSHDARPRRHPVDAWANTWRCTITVYPNAHRLTYSEACALIVHEFGHLAGVRHSRNPLDVMFPVVDPAAVPEC